MNTNKLLTLSILLFTLITITPLTKAAETPPTAPTGFDELLKARPDNGKVLLPGDFDLSKPGAKWQDWEGSRMVYEQTYRQFGSYKLDIDNPEKGITREVWSEKGFPVKVNRTYVASALIKTDFPRNEVEIDFALRLFGKVAGSDQPVRIAPRHLMGAPATTQGPDGWQRLEWKVNIPDDPSLIEARPSIVIYAGHVEKPIQFRVADIAFTELPAQPLKVLSRGAGVEFPGGPGDLPMRIESAQAKNDHVIVETTGAKFDFDTKNNTILAGQRIEFPRDLAKWQSSLSLAGLRIDKKTDDVVVLTNDNLTIGIQGDSMMAISPQKELTMTLTNLLGGDFNRYARGHLFSTDDFGGITVNPYIPMGTGLKAQSKLLTDNLSFAHFEEREYDVTGKAAPNWQAQWTTRPGELLCTSVFPPRPYPWEESFKFGWRLIRRGYALDNYKKVPPHVSAYNLWDFIPLQWGHSYSDYYEPYDETEIREHIQAIHDNDTKVMYYASAYWTPTRDADIYIDGIRQFKEKYGIDGVYSDGLPSADWLLAYKEMRMLRALFPDGPIVIHDSFRQSGKPVSMFMPFMYTYATAMYMAEGIETKTGEHWQYPRYVTSMFRKTNGIGMTKGDKWLDEKGEKMGTRKALVDDVYNGRDNFGFNYPDHYNVLDQLHELWKEKGNDPHFYDRYYLPKAQELTGYKIGRTAMPIVERQGNSISLKSLSPNAAIYYTTDGSDPTEKSTRYKSTFSVDSKAVVKAIAIAPDLEPSAVAIIAGK